MVYFIESPRRLPMVPWDPDRPAVHLDHVSDSEEQVRTRFPGAGFVYYLGSHLNCGCGFRCETLGEEPEEASAKQHSHERLAEYIAALPEEARPIRIFGLWTGDEEEPTEHLRDVALSRLRDPDFQFRERELLTVVFDEPGPR